ncbi:conserved hypothetical protein [Methanococcus vannielii SB]|uniref:DUF2149 domain-containing protein n=1 Tax=Methanococcus vannielii (strain ATCC 35089 / DSM 1224 / JCM 13029 / OCM 148 / SB) TaxID=406327 RepID=A6UNL8_METVS|nr:DUF2149 domain-containing protein [Methanococcus vannielii]ABR54090.1 conserved hypothetical protein [Methanococcus vannielii SB]
MIRKKNRKRFNKGEEDPMAGTSNLVDAMLVLSVGFLIFLVMSWNMQNVIFSDTTPEEKMEIMRAMRQVAEVSMAKEISDIPEIQDGSGVGYEQMGTVYKDPATGRYIMIEK